MILTDGNEVHRRIIIERWWVKLTRRNHNLRRFSLHLIYDQQFRQCYQEPDLTAWARHFTLCHPNLSFGTLCCMIGRLYVREMKTLIVIFSIDLTFSHRQREIGKYQRTCRYRKGSNLSNASLRSQCGSWVDDPETCNPYFYFCNLSQVHGFLLDGEMTFERMTYFSRDHHVLGKFQSSNINGCTEMEYDVHSVGEGVEGDGDCVVLWKGSEGCGYDQNENQSQGRK